MNDWTQWACALCIAAASTQAGAQPPAAPIKIGLPVPLTGPYGAEAKGTR